MRIYIKEMLVLSKYKHTHKHTYTQTYSHNTQ